MKLTDLAIDGIGVCNNVNFSRFGNGLNLVYGENASGKSTIRRYVAGVLYGFSDPFWRNFLNQPIAGRYAGRGGKIQLSTSEGDAYVSRPIQTGASVEVTTLEGHPHHISNTSLVAGIDAQTFDAFYNVDFQNRVEQAFRAAAQLQSQLGVPTGLSRWTSETEYRSWKTQADTRLARLDSLGRDLESAKAQRASVLQELENWRRQCESKWQNVEADLSDVTRRLNDGATQMTSLRAQIESMDREIELLRNQIENAAPSVRYVPTAPPQSDRLAALYERLDEIDNQIGRWRRVQTDIQNQRVRLRDEMIVWNDLTMESEEHPYFRAREILVDIESRLDEIENQARHWESGHVSQNDPTIAARNIVANCSPMRDQLYSLCQELGDQYKHIRHRAAVAELKQLRRCYKEMGDNIKRLVNRRENTIVEIRQFDPAGAEAIVRANNQFCDCARHEGYLEARRRFVGAVDVNMASQVDYTVVQPDLSSERSQLADLQNRKVHLINQLNSLDAQSVELESQRLRLVSERDRLRSGNEAELNDRVLQLDGAIHRITAEVNALQIEVDQDRRLASAAPNPLLAVASQYLTRMSEGDLNQVWLTSDESRIQVTDRRGATIPYSTLGPGDQHLVTLSLCLAGVEGQRANAPMMLDDVFSNIDTPRAIATAQLLGEIGNNGQQIIAFTCHRAALDRLSQLPDRSFSVFELPQTSVSPTPVVYPERIPTAPSSPTRSETDYLYPPAAPEFTRPPALRTYPYMKYPVVESTKEPLSEFQSDVVSPPASNVDSRVLPRIAEIVTLRSRLHEIGLLDRLTIQVLSDVGVVYVEQLLDLDPDQLPNEFHKVGLTPFQVDRVQAESWLLVCVPGMDPLDAHVLVASGIQEPEQLDTTPYHQLVNRVGRFLESKEGRTLSTNYDFDRANADRWYDALRATRDNWRREQGYSRRTRRQSHPSNDRITSELVRSPVASNGHSDGNSHLASSSVSSPRKRKNRKGSEQVNSGAAAVSTSNAAVGDRLKFYLDLTDHIEAAPSIGPRTAERFEKIGVVTIADFLRQTAESMASKVNYKRITESVIRQWQNQTRLVCRVPNLRGHDAQLLVACGITDPEELAVMNPEKVYGIVGPFSETKEGLKIIRSGKKPDLAEVKDWIDWASNHRNLQAA